MHVTPDRNGLDSDRNRTDSGQFSPEVSDEDILVAFRDARKPFLTAREAAEIVGLERSAMYRRLERLRNEGPLEKEKVGGRAVVWWLPDDTNI